MTQVPQYDLSNDYRIPMPSPDEPIRREFRTGTIPVMPRPAAPLVMTSREEHQKRPESHVQTAPAPKPQVQTQPLATPRKHGPALTVNPGKAKSFDLRLCSWCGGRLTAAQVDGIHGHCAALRDRVRKP